MRSDMEFWKEVRRRVLTNELSKRRACEEYGRGWRTLKKILAHDEPPGYRNSRPRAKPKIETFLPIIHQILLDDRQAPKRHRDSLCAANKRVRGPKPSAHVPSPAITIMATGEVEQAHGDSLPAWASCRRWSFWNSKYCKSPASQVASVGGLLTVQTMNTTRDAAMAMSPATIQYLELLSKFMASQTSCSKPAS